MRLRYHFLFVLISLLLSMAQAVTARTASIAQKNQLDNFKKVAIAWYIEKTCHMLEKDQKRALEWYVSNIHIELRNRLFKSTGSEKLVIETQEQARDIVYDIYAGCDKNALDDLEKYLKLARKMSRKLTGRRYHAARSWQHHLMDNYYNIKMSLAIARKCKFNNPPLSEYKMLFVEFESYVKNKLKKQLESYNKRTRIKKRYGKIIEYYANCNRFAKKRFYFGYIKLKQFKRELKY